MHPLSGHRTCRYCEIAGQAAVESSTHVWELYLPSQRVRSASIVFGGEEFVDERCCFVHCVSRKKTRTSTASHFFPFNRTQLEPPLQQPLSAGQGVFVDQACPVCFDIRPDVYLVADKHGAAGTKCFHNRNSKILLVRREDESLASPQSSPFHIAADHSRPVHSGSDAEARSEEHT